jgi:hypothetical protein
MQKTELRNAEFRSLAGVMGNPNDPFGPPLPFVDTAPSEQGPFRRVGSGIAKQSAGTGMMRRAANLDARGTVGGRDV